MSYKIDELKYLVAVVFIVVCHPLFVVRRLPSVVRRSPFTVRRPSSAVRRLSSAVRRPPSERGLTMTRNNLCIWIR
ncbi:MAG TPA: hypothetical protein ENJ53_01355 [Phaeodactylibacter sp.]|nr:hypothetical protein [Phaeodactylibacter sp.]